MSKTLTPQKVTYTKVPLGETIHSKIIQRCDVAEGTKGRVVPIYDGVVGINIFWTDEPKGSWLCTPEEALSVGINPKFYYVIPVFRLNTDAKAAVKDSSMRLEYLRIGAMQYDELVTVMNEQEKAITSLVITKVKKGEYSYVNPTSSTKALPPEIEAKCKEMRESLNEDQVFEFAIADIARPFSEYLKASKALARKNSDGEDDESSQNSSEALKGLPTPNLSNKFEEAKDEFEEDEE